MSRCELCNNFGSVKIKYDLDSAREHTKTHFRQLNIVDDQVSADLIFEECFPVYQQAAARRGKPAKNVRRQILVDVCHSLYPRKCIPDLPSHIACAKCGMEYKLIRPNKSLNTAAIIDHASSHLKEKELYECRHCSRQYQSEGSVRSHLADVHRITSIDGHFEDKSHNFVKEISDQIKSCFGQNVRVRTVNWFKKSELAIERQLLCQQLIRKVADPDHRIKCRLCSSQLSIKNRDGHSSRSAMEHVLQHLRKPTKRCRICLEVFVSRHRLRDHFRNVHSLPTAKKYECVADEFHTEILVLLEKSYGTKAERNAIEDKIAPTAEKVIRQNSKGSELAIERTLFCHQLIRKFANHEKQLCCRLCSKWINADHVGKSRKTDDVMQHALRHLTKPLYRCKQCSTAYSSSRAMASHLRRKHALPLGNNHVCSQDEHHSEISAMLRECYGDKRDGQGME